MALDNFNIETKEDSAAKLAAAEGNPTKYFLFADEFNSIKTYLNQIKTYVNSLLIDIANKVNISSIESDVLPASTNPVSGGAVYNALIAFQDFSQEYVDNEIALLKDGVSTPGNTLQKLYNLILGASAEAYVANITERNAYNVPHLPFSIFVNDDGDGRWAKYQATTTGVGATFVKLSDPDLLNAAMSASAIKAAYESNPDTNAFTNALLTKLNSIATGATANSSDATLLNRSNHTGTQLASTISDFTTAVNALLGSYLTISSAASTYQTLSAATTGAVISFVVPQIYNSPSSPSAANITNNLTGAAIGVIQKIYHNNSSAPTFPGGWVKIGSGSYVNSSLNIIFAEWISGTRVEYWIVQ